MGFFNKLFNSDSDKENQSEVLHTELPDELIKLLDEHKTVYVPLYQISNHRKELCVLSYSNDRPNFVINHRAIRAKVWDELSIDAQETLNKEGYFRVELDSLKAIDKTKWNELSIDAQKALIDQGFHPIDKT